MLFYAIFGIFSCLCCARNCNIEKIFLSSITNDILAHAPEYPVVYVCDYPDCKQEEILTRSSPDYLLNNFGESTVILSSSNAYSHDKEHMSLRKYFEYLRNPGTRLANETFYLFGNNDKGIWKELGDLYHIQKCGSCDRAGAKVFGVGGKYSGVSFHLHGPGFSEVMFGSKRWFLYPAGYAVPGFDPNMTMIDWASIMLNESYNSTKWTRDLWFNEVGVHTVALQHVRDHLYDCTIVPGEILYFPSGWMHGTMNMEDLNIFVSTFIDHQLIE